MQTISTEQLEKMKAGGDSFTLINVLSPEQFEQEHIPGSKNIPVDSDDFIKRVEDVAGGKDSKVVIYCAGKECDASPRAARMLDKAGFRNVFDYEGGTKAWHQTGREVEGAAKTSH